MRTVKTSGNPPALVDLPPSPGVAEEERDVLDGDLLTSFDVDLLKNSADLRDR